MLEKCVNLKISNDRRFIIKENGEPFFWLADTAWELFHRLECDEAVEYLATRASQGFTVIQAVALSEFDGLTVPNAYDRLPLLKNKDGNFDPTTPDVEPETERDSSSYWEHMDFIIDRACSLGLYIGLLPTWGDKFNIGWGKGPEIFTPENAFVYGKWIGERYRNKSNIIWIMGGDRPLENETHEDIVRNMATGIKLSTGNKHLMTYHPVGFNSSSKYVHDELWLDFNMIQSGHGGINIKNYEFIQKDYALYPVKPTLDGEPRYEDHPVDFKADNGYFDDYDVRVAAYWSMLSGACGHTYGHHCIWSFNTEKKDYFVMDWKKAIHRPGAENMTHLKKLFTSRPFLELASWQELLNENYSGANYMSVSRGKKYAYVYTPNGLDIKINMNMLADVPKIENETKIKYTAYWYNPRNGEYIFADSAENTEDFRFKEVVTFVPPSSGRNSDWVLVIDFSNKNGEDND